MRVDENEESSEKLFGASSLLHLSKFCYKNGKKYIFLMF